MWSWVEASPASTQSITLTRTFFSSIFQAGTLLFTHLPGITWAFHSEAEALRAGIRGLVTQCSKHHLAICHLVEHLHRQSAPYFKVSLSSFKTVLTIGKFSLQFSPTDLTPISYGHRIIVTDVVHQVVEKQPCSIISSQS